MIKMKTRLAACVPHRLRATLFALAAAVVAVASARAQQSFIQPEQPETPAFAERRGGVDAGQATPLIRPLQPQSVAPAVAGLPAWAAALDIDPVAVDLMVRGGDFVDIELPRGPDDVVVARLRRVDVIAPDASIILQGPGEAVEPLSLTVTVWSGHVVGQPDSDVFLGLSPTQAQGWIVLGGRTHLIATRPTPAGPLTLAYDQDDFNLPGAIKPPTCQGELTPPGFVPPPPTGEAGYAPRTACKAFRVAVDTDSEFELVSGGSQNAAEYAVILVAAANVIFTREASVGFELGFLRIWNGADPWNGSDTAEQLGQFRDYWRDNMDNVSRSSAHLFSGRSLGGGIAYLRAACSDDWGYAVSADMNGSFPFPLQDNSPDNWDITVVAHEWGHQFGSGHTHNVCEYTPIIDGCGLSEANPACENGEKDCSVAQARNGTVMSYCHTCAGGISNIKLTLGPRVATRIAEFAASVTCATLRSPPSVTGILADPSADVCEGGPITLTAQASGDALRFQWFRNGTRVDGATSRSFTIANPVAGDQWDVMVYSPCGVVTTQGTSMTLRLAGNPPVITDDPDSQLVCPRAIVSFAVQATGTEPPRLNYQWFRDGQPLADGFIGTVRFSGSSTPRLTIYGVTDANAGEQYACVVANSCGTAESLPAILDVAQAQPDPLLLASGDQLAGVDGSIFASVMWDPDGPDGPAIAKLVVGGRFKVAGPFAANNVAVFDPVTERWEPLGFGLGGISPEGVPLGVDALAVIPNDQDGFDLVAAGDFTLSGTATVNRVARWDGTTWTPLGSGLDARARALAVVDGTDLVVGGDFATAGGEDAARVARWNGSPWSPLGSGGFNSNSAVNALAVLPDGRIVAGGDFTAPVRHIAAWDGTAWSALGSGVNDPVVCMRVLANGDLVVGGDFDFASGVPAKYVARWSDDSWSAIGTGFNSTVLSIEELPDGDLIATGLFTQTFDPLTGDEVPVTRLARWNEVNGLWSPVGSGGFQGVSSIANTVTALARSASDNAFVVGGDFDLAGIVPVGRVAIHDDGEWSAMGSGVIGRVSALKQIPVGDMVAGHTVNYKNGPKGRRIAKWNGLSWSGLRDGTTQVQGVDRVVNAFLQRSDGLIVGGEFFNVVELPESDPARVLNRIGRWNGSTWSPLGPGFNGAVNALAELPGGDVVAGGSFTFSFPQPDQPQISLRRIGRWNGTVWAPMGTGMNSGVNALLVLQNGDLIAGGGFTNVSGITILRIARWNGTGWAPVGAGFNATVRALAELPDGSLVAAGDFTASGSVTLNRIARWDGSAWQPLGDGIAVEAPGTVNALTLFPNGDLFAAGTFTDAGGVSVSGVARWDGTQWLPPGEGVTGVDGEVKALAALQPAGEVVVGGGFSIVRTLTVDLISPFISRYGYRNAPPILVHPEGRVVPRGQTLVLTAMPGNGFSDVSVQWRRNGVNLVNIPGKIEGAFANLPSPTAGSLATLTVYDFAPEDVGAYAAVFSNSCGFRYTDVAIGDLSCVPPSILVQPVAVRACPKDFVTFSLVADGYPAPSFQWRRNGVNIPGALGSSLTLPLASEADLGAYSCVVSNPCGTVTSSAATLEFNSPPVIASQPVLQRVCLGNPATFAVSVAGSPPLRFQWRRNGNDIPGARSATLSFAQADFSDVASYDCVITNDCGSVLSNKARLEIGAGPRISPLPPSTPACTGSPLALVVTVTDTVGNVSYRWRKNGAPITGAIGSTCSLPQPTSADNGEYDCVVTDACGTAFSTVTLIDVAAGEPSIITDQPDDVVVCSDQPATFAIVATGNPSFQWQKDGVDIPGATQATFTIDAVASADVGSYSCVLSRACGTFSSEAASLQLSSAPDIDTQPTSRFACEGTPATFAIAASAETSLAYQWRRNGVPINGAVNPFYVVSSVSAANAGTYDCVVTAGCSSVTSKAAELVVGAPNDQVSGALPLVDSVPLAGDTSCATVDATPLCSSNQPVSTPGLWYRLVGTGNSVTVSLCGSPFDTRLSVFCGSEDAITCIAENDNFCDLASSVTFCTRSGADYFVLVHGNNGEFGEFSIRFSDTQLPCPVPATCAPVGACCVGQACVQLSAAACAAQGGTFLGEGVPCRYIAFDAGVSSTGPFPARIRDRRAVTASVVIPAGSGQVTDLAVRLGLSHGFVGDLSITLSRAGTSVPLVVRSASRARFDGQVTFTDLAVDSFADAGRSGSVVASGIYRPAAALAAFAGQPLEGTWTIEVRDNADFDVGVLTAFSILTAGDIPACSGSCQPPVIDQQPVSLVRCENARAELSIQAAGSPSLTYQWLKDGSVQSPVDESNGTARTPTLVIDQVRLQDAGTYTCVVTNTCGQVVSVGVSLAVTRAPVITGQPQPDSSTLCAGAPLTLSLAVTGSPTLNFQWRKGGVDISGNPSAATRQLSIAAVNSSDAGTYTCVVTNTCGSVTTLPVTLAVNTPPVITTQPVSRSVCDGGSVTFSVLAAGTPPPSLQWRKGDADIPGATSASYAIASASPADAGTYTCVVTNACGSVTSAPATLTFNTRPVITTHPVSRSVCDGGSVTFSVLATGSPAPSYRWRKNGAPLLDNATSAFFTIPAAAVADGGIYDCIVTNVCGTATSLPATLEVVRRDNDLISGAVTLLPSIAIVGDTTCARVDNATPVCLGPPPTAPGVWYRVAGTGTDVTVSLCGSSFDTRLSIFCGSESSLACVASNDDACAAASSVSFCTQFGADYYVLVHGNGVAAGPFTIIFTDSQVPCAATTSCTSFGACCLASNGCIQVKSDECDALGGTFIGEGVPCDTVAYPERFFSAEVFPVEIPNPGSATTTIDVPAGSGLIQGLVARVGISHQSVGDLVVTLSRGDTSVVLVDRPDGNADLVGKYAFSMLAPASFIDAASGVPFVQPSVYLPAASLAAFDGQPFEGLWKVEVRDLAGAGVGQILSFALLNGEGVPACDFCVADFNGDGGIDGADVEAFFFAWQNGDPAADVNLDGGVDGSDIEPFFILWEAGGC